MTFLSRKGAIALMIILLVILIFGTQMPGALRDQALSMFHSPWQMTKVAYFVVFALIAFLAHLAPLTQPPLRVATAALALALLTEGMQYLAVNRSPTWLDVVINMAGAGCGLAVAWGLMRWKRPR